MLPLRQKMADYPLVSVSPGVTRIRRITQRANRPTLFPAASHTWIRSRNSKPTAPVSRRANIRNAPILRWNHLAYKTMPIYRAANI